MMMVKYPLIPALDPLFKLTREDFFAPFEALMDDVFNGVLQEFPGAVKSGTTQRLYPKTDVYQSGNDLVFQSVIPFAKKEDVKVELTGNILVISGESSKEEEDGTRKYFRKELRKSKFTRAFTLPDEVVDKNGEMDAEFVDGILTVVFKDAYKVVSEEETPKTKLIDIK